MKSTATPEPSTPRPHKLLAARQAGGAAPWIILVVVVLGLLGVLTLWGPGRGVPDETEAPSNAAAAPADTDISGTLEELGDLLIKAAENKRDIQPLIDRLDKVLAEHPDSAEAHTLHAQMLLEAGRPADALAAFQASLKIQPRNAQLNQVAGDLALNLKEYEDARHHYEQAMSIEPTNSKHAVSLANLQVRLNEDDAAIETLLTVLRRDSQLHSAYALMADIYAKKNKLQLALEQTQRAIDTAPESSPNTRTVYVLKRASLLRRDNQPAESLAALNALSPEAHLQPTVLRDIATSWAMLGKPQMAAELYERVLTADPSSAHAAAQAANWRIKAGDLDAAKQHLQSLRRIDPRHESLIDLENKLRESSSAIAE